MGLPPEKWGYSNPIISPLYPPPPIYWPGARVQLILYETKEENIKEVIPYPLEPNGNKVIAWISDFPVSTQGAFHEAALYVQVKYGKYKGVYEPFLYVTSEVPLTGGREIWGYQKKLANITLTLEREYAKGVVERGGVKLMTAFSVLERPAKLEELPFGPIFSLKYIPSAEEGGKPLRQLILVEGELKARTGEFFGGRGSINFERSEIDPLYKLEPTRVIAGYYGIFDAKLPYGKIVYEY
jgi:acetoacetate decarboxylase